MFINISRQNPTLEGEENLLIIKVSIQGVPKEVLLFDKESNNGLLFYCLKIVSF